MVDAKQPEKWQTDGKFFLAGERRVWVKCVTYGPFPGGWPVNLGVDFKQIVAAGFNAIRTYTLPDLQLLDAAQAHGLKVFGGLAWWQGADFFRQRQYFSAAEIGLVSGLKALRQHPALIGIYVGNEIPSDLVKWMGPLQVRNALEELIRLGKEIAPHLLFAYANYPSTEYLEPENADFSAFNIYLEDETAFRKYLKRLHHIAGDRPLVISEFGLDTLRNGMVRQAETLVWAMLAAKDLDVAGMTIYGWSDRWQNGAVEVLDWDFGLLDRAGKAKPALAAITEVPREKSATDALIVSVIVCTRNGSQRLGACLKALQKVAQVDEILVVDDGSRDGSAEFVADHFPQVSLLRLTPSGLSAARNAGAAAAHGDIFAFTDDDCEADTEWISRLLSIFQNGKYAAVGGPNLPPVANDREEAIVSAAPGAPSHVMLDDEEAEHLPGCNLAVTREAFEKIGGFDVQFTTAGDDVDFCWRLRDAGFRLGFAPGAFVWHKRRGTVGSYLRQQIGYGHAEHLLQAKFPERFSDYGGAKWQGVVYGGCPVRVMEGSVIYHGALGDAAYQGISLRVLPRRGLAEKFDGFWTRLYLKWVSLLQLQLRSWARNRRLVPWHQHKKITVAESEFDENFFDIPATQDRTSILQKLLAQGWHAAGETDEWDLEKGNSRLVLALERHPGGAMKALVRIWGDQRVSLPHENL